LRACGRSGSGHTTSGSAGALGRPSLEAGGSTLRDYARIDGSAGAFQTAFEVYDREGEPCLRPGCRGRIRRTVQAGRSSFWCPVCQR
jgi:formamidopyrimidine-DNA glycosylase